MQETLHIATRGLRSAQLNDARKKRKCCVSTARVIVVTSCVGSLLRF